ncbi:MAG: hypothetical protein H7Z43_00555 [Clostridia bacterium]|nr:hypothetical protein [Deltaproteobacteria bacterium]
MNAARDAVDDPRLPGLSTAGWAAVLFAGLLTLTLGFFPFLPRRSAERMLSQHQVSVIADVVMATWFGPTLAIAAVAALVLAVSGEKTAPMRNGWAACALVIALAGNVAVYGALYSSIAPH